jgi:hypothetical protein
LRDVPWADRVEIVTADAGRHPRSAAAAPPTLLRTDLLSPDGFDHLPGCRRRGVYWHSISPFHGAVFGGMIANIAVAAERP